MTNQANDVRQTVPMVDQMIDNLDAAGVTENVKAFTADAGYFSEENMAAVDDNARIDAAYIATGRQKHSDAVPDSPKGRPPIDMTAKQKMARRNRTKKGRMEYARRKVIIEPAPFSLNTVVRSKLASGFVISSCEVLRRCRGNGIWCA